MPNIPVLGRQKQEDCLKSKASPTQQDPVLLKEKKKELLPVGKLEGRKMAARIP